MPLTGAISFTAGAFNTNGIDATKNGKTLVIVQSNTGKLFTVTPTGMTAEIPLGGASVPNGDGILLDGRTLYVVQNQLNQIAKIRLAHGLTSGQIVGTITDSDFDIPATVDKLRQEPLGGQRTLHDAAHAGHDVLGGEDEEVIEERRPYGGVTRRRRG